MRSVFAMVPALVCLTSVAVAAAATQTAQPAATADPDVIRAHMRFLADDLLEGRETGSRGEAIAAAYIVSRFEALGLAPAGSNGTYYQPVPLVETAAADRGHFAFKGNGVEQTLRFGEDYVPVASFAPRLQQLETGVAFVGFGIVAAQRHIDSYSGLDVHGKVVLALSGAPSNLPSEERAYYSSVRLKQEEAARHGAAALVMLYTPTKQRVKPFERLAREWDDTRATWSDAAGVPFARGVPELALVSLSGGRKLLADAPVPFDQVMREAEQNTGKIRSFLLPITASIEAQSRITRSRSSNLIAVVPGADPRLKDQYVVLSAHYDHLGMKTSGQGDLIYNGALDNAAGVAVLLETARLVAQGRPRPRRSILFAMVTAEEAGLVGSDYFARNPTVPRASIVADVNIDMPLLTYDFTDIIAFGAGHSTLGPIVSQVAARFGVRSSPDPVPEQAVFIRSDHFRFVQQGIPSIMIATGFAGAGSAAYEDFLAHRYHQPTDDLQQAIDYAAGAKLASLVHAIAIAIAEDARAPAWNAGDFFGTRLAPSHRSRR